jgi:hypothetical protein
MYDFTYSIDSQFITRNNSIQNVRGRVNQKRGKKDSFAVFISSDLLCRYHYPGISTWEYETDPRSKQSGRVIDFERKESIDTWFAGFEKFMAEAGHDFSSD